MTHFFYNGGPGLVKLASARSQDWIGVDMDGTLAEYHGFKGPDIIGAPVPTMVKRVKAWLDKGERVKIFTARANMPKAVTAIKAWCKEHLGKELPVTNVKDHRMRELWDDRAHRVEKNTGVKLASAGRGKNSKKSLGWAYVRLPKSVRDAMKQLRDKIDPADLSEDGKEGHPHITVMYGFTESDPEVVRKAVGGNGGGSVRMGKTSLFRNDERDVLKVSVTGRALHALHKSLDGVDNENKFKTFVPHATLAYLKPGTGDKYKNLDLADGLTFDFTGFVFEDADDNATDIELGAAKQAQALGIPDMAVYGDVLGTLKPGDITDFVLQRHDTVRNPKNPHYDMRLGTKDTNLFSWAVPGAVMPEPGQIKRPLPQTQLHTYQYGSFEGKIDCVAAGTLITCADGPHPIEKLQPDRDEVHVLGLGSRGLTFYRVQRLYRNVTRHQWLRLCVKAANGELHTLVCGPEHGLYRLGQGFIRAKDITVGHTVALHHGTEPLFQHIMAAGADQYEISRVMGGADDPGHQMVHAQILRRPATTADTVTCSHNAYRTLPVLPVHRPCVIDGTPTHCARPAQSPYSMALKRFLDTLSANVQRVRDLCLAKTFVKVHPAQGCGVAECWRRTVTQYLCCAFARCTEILHNQCAQLFMLVRRSAGIQAFTYDYAAIDAQPVRDLCEGQSGPQQRQNLSFVERTAPTHLSPQLSDTNGISWGTIVQVESVTESQEAFDLLVDDAHNYFAQGLLVHNSGYGKGTVSMADKGEAIITKVTPNTLHFTLGHQKVPMRYVLIHTGGKDGKMWQLLAKAQPGKIPGVGDKPIYKQIQAVDKDDAIAQAQALQEKIDGAHGIVNINAKGDVDVYSVRPSVKGAPIAHTERMGVFGVRVPQLRNTAMRGELYYTDAKGKAVPFNDVSGLLNMLPSRSLRAQRERGLKPRIALFDTLTGETPGTVEDRGRRIREALKLLPSDIFHAPAEARTLSEKEQLFRTIAEGKNPRTSEGVMAVMPDGSIRKIKNKAEATATLTGTYPGRGKRKGSAGGLTFKLDGVKGEGRVGTGFTDAQLADIVARLQELKGSPMRLEHMGQFGTGKLRAPSFKGFETDKAAAVAAHMRHPDVRHVMSYKDAQSTIPRAVERITNISSGQTLANARHLARARGLEAAQVGADISAGVADIASLAGHAARRMSPAISRAAPALGTTAGKFAPAAGAVGYAIDGARTILRPQQTMDGVAAASQPYTLKGAPLQLLQNAAYGVSYPVSSTAALFRESGRAGTAVQDMFNANRGSRRTRQQILERQRRVQAARTAPAPVTGTNVGTNVPTMGKAGSAEAVRLQFKSKDGTIKASATVEIADTPRLRAKGLSKRAQLAPDHGMFFDKAGTYWMKDVAFPLDIVFVDKAGTVLGKTAMAVEADPSSPTRHYRSPQKAAHAIELPLGWCDRNGIGVGDVVTTN